MDRLKTAAAREVQMVEKFRKWDDGEFGTQFATLDRQKAVLEGLTEAADFDKAKEAAVDIHSAAVWIADNAEAREGLDAIAKAIDNLSRDLENVEAKRYAQATLYEAETARNEAVGRRDRSDFTGAKEKFDEAKRLTEEAIAAARETQRSIKAREAIGEAEAAKIGEDWETVVAKAEAALSLEPDNTEAKKLKNEAEGEIAAIKAEQKRVAQEEAERKAREEAARKAQEEAARKAQEEAERKAREEAERKAREETAKKAERRPRIICEDEDFSPEVESQILDYAKIAISKLDMKKRANRLIKEKFESETTIIKVKGPADFPVALISDVGIAPAMSVDNTGTLNFVYGKPSLTIETMETEQRGDSRDVAITFTIVPAKGNDIVANVNTKCFHVYGANATSLTCYRRMNISKFDLSSFLEEESKGTLTTYFSSGSESFFKGVLEE